MTHPHPLIRHLFINKYDNTYTADYLLQLNELKKYNINFKRHGNLIIFNYISTDNSNNILQNVSKGTIIDLVKKNIVCNSINGDIKYEYFKNMVPIQNCVIEENIEGTLLNVYFYNNRWNVSSRFCINADESRYRSNKTFRQLFDSLVKIDDLSLNNKYTYSFKLITPENRQVLPIKKPILYHIETTNNITCEKIYSDIGVQKPKILFHYKYNHNLNLNNYKELEVHINNLEWYKKGYALFSEDRKIKSSLLNSEYNKIKLLTYNQSDIRFICLESLYYKKNKNIILKYYPEFKIDFNLQKKKFDKLVNKVYNLYVNCKCKKLNVQIPIHLEKTIRKLHQIYKKNINDSNNFKIKKMDVRNYLLSLECSQLFIFINNCEKL